MSATSIAERVRCAAAASFGFDEAVITADTCLYKDVGADSLAVMELISALEDDLGAWLPESNEFALSIRTIGDLVAAFETYAS